MMRTITSAVVMSVFVLGSVPAPTFAQNAAAACQTKAVDKTGKTLAGAAKTSFMYKCLKETCEARAIDKNGKPLAGAAKNSFMNSCRAS